MTDAQARAALCEMVAPLLVELAGSFAAGGPGPDRPRVTVLSQDDPSFPDDLAAVVDDPSRNAREWLLARAANERP